MSSDFAVSPNTMIGDPGGDAVCFPGQQAYPDTCAIRCQEFLLERFTGIDAGEDQLVAEAQAHGWYTPGVGTSPADLGNLLELHGIPVNRYENTNIWQLTAELAQGHKVMIGVDSGELWQQHPVLEAIEDGLGISGADHAVVVSGIDTTDPTNPMVIISDPGTGEAAASYPMAQFLDAWQDSSFFMVATQDPAPLAFNPEMVNFDYAAGHIPEVVPGVSYDEFEQLEHQPDLWDKAVDHLATLDHDGADPLGHDGQELGSQGSGLEMMAAALGSELGSLLGWLGLGHDGDGASVIASHDHPHDQAHHDLDAGSAEYDGGDPAFDDLNRV